MGGKGKVKIPVADYLMSIHYAICKGQLDSINQIFSKEKPIWCGRVAEETTLDVNLPDLFGGDKKEGGPVGAVECYLGTADQLMSTAVAVRHGKTPATMPGYRGIASLFFRGFGAGGFKWISNNPYLPGAWVNVTRLPRTLSDSYKAIYEVDPVAGGSIVDGIGEKFPITTGALNTWYEYDLLGLGIPAAEIDEGAAPGVDPSGPDVELGVRVMLAIEVLSTTVSTVGVDLEFYGASTDPGDLLEIGFIGQTAFDRMDGANYVFDVACSDNVPAGTRFVRVRFNAIAGEIFVEASEDSFFIYGLGTDPNAHCGLDALGKLPDANPAHMIYEALTDRDWGMGTPATLIDMTSFMYSAELFHTERFGLSITWTKQAEIQSYISEILDHVQANLFMDPRTGLWTLVPLRGDYDPDTLPVLDPTNCKALNRQRKANGETINEITVTWTNPNNEKEETITKQDLASLAAQDGEIISSQRNYYGVRNAALASKLVDRDLRSSSYPIWGCDIVAHRSLSFLRPGSVAKLNWPEDGIEGMIIGVGKVDYGKPGDSAIKFPCTEDVFALDVAQFTGSQGSLWETPEVAPTAVPYVQPLTAPLPLLLRSGVSLSDIADDDYPSVITAVLADHDVAMEFVELNGPVTRPNGDVAIDALGSILPTASGVVPTELLAEPSSTLPGAVITAIAAPQTPQPGDFLYLAADDTDFKSEIIMLDAFDGTDWTLARGMFDTVPRRWPHSSRAWFLGDDLDARDPTAQVAGVAIPYQLRPKTSGGLLPLASAPVVSFTPSERPYLPFRPADVEFLPDDGTPIVATLPAEAGALVPLLYWLGDQPTSGVLNWANRSRLSEDTVAPRWGAGTITPEAGQSTTIRVRDLTTDTVLSEDAGITGTTATVDLTVITTVGRYAIEVLSVRDGFESLQFASQLVNVIESGYGNAYGLDYSG